MKYARIENNIAVEIFEHATIKPDEVHPEVIANQFIAVPSIVDVGWSNITGSWVAPEPELNPTVFIEPPKAKIMSPVSFKLLFTSAERVAIRAERQNDPIIDDFFDIIDDQRLNSVSLTSAQTIECIDYLQSKGLISEERANAIKSGDITS